MRPARISDEAIVGPPTSMSNPGSALSRATSATASSRTRRLFHSTRSSVRENTIFGVSLQMPANRRMTGVAAGSASAVGQ